MRSRSVFRLLAILVTTFCMSGKNSGQEVEIKNNGHLGKYSDKGDFEHSTIRKVGKEGMKKQRKRKGKKGKRPKGKKVNCRKKKFSPFCLSRKFSNKIQVIEKKMKRFNPLKGLKGKLTKLELTEKKNTANVREVIKILSRQFFPPAFLSK